MGLAFVFKCNGFIVMTNRNRRRYRNTENINGKQRLIPGNYIPPNEFSQVPPSLGNSLLQLAGEQSKLLCHGWAINGLALSVRNDCGWNWGSSKSARAS